MEIAFNSKNKNKKIKSQKIKIKNKEKEKIEPHYSLIASSFGGLQRETGYRSS